LSDYTNAPDNEQQRRRPSRSGGDSKRRFTRRPRVCRFCSEKITSLDYKQVDLLKRYVKEDGRIRPRRETGTCAKHQRILARAVKRARHMAILPFASENWR